ncbi:NAD(P)/FAD-dependent oxidoreductase [Marivita hallyeonensis]|uniref:Glycine/D-amino acid oxidase n=1 Tax=Marivita hallyeonensis TaxID=996342 RepID=A0A1M5T9U3_9RHOB|nr:FAD-binding oxidoreductase [Marivita hallyeonensis]SHH47390.1 Glycine/D-amino acid oxidase [Marivita hallyeonensis]
MRRIYEDAAYRTPGACWWRESAAPAALPRVSGDRRTEVAIIGGGFTGLNAALVLANAGIDATVIDTEQPGWGASGRNGGFCCLGGSKASGKTIGQMFGTDQRVQWHKAERAAVDHVAALLSDHGIDAETHSDGETVLAHSPKAMLGVRQAAQEAEQTYGVAAEVFDRAELRQRGLNGDFHGGMTLPIGFALNPGKYHAGLLRAVQDANSQVFGQTPAIAINRDGEAWRVDTPSGSVRAQKVILATNGYSSEDVPDWLRGRYLPVQSTIIVTRPITAEEQVAQGWTSLQMCYDSRILLHYFRLMPDGRFLFGMRGGLRATPTAEAQLARKIRADFARLFPAWRDVDINHEWSGLLCLTRRLTPFAGPVPDMPGVFAAFGYHGNGVAMGSYAGARLADLVMGRAPTGPFPDFLSLPPRRFPLGSKRRVLPAPAYAVAALFDR